MAEIRVAYDFDSPEDRAEAVKLADEIEAKTGHTAVIMRTAMA